MNDREIVINVNGLKKSFNGNTVLDGIDFQLFRGENLVVLGKSGVGKSVLIKCLVRLVEPDDGELDILGYKVRRIRDEDRLNEFRRRIGFLFQGGALYDSMSVEENLKFPLERKPDRERLSVINEKVREVLKSVGLERAIHKMPAELSGGMKKRVALARTLILRPDIMLYDEPTTGLDPVTSKEISNLLVATQQKYNISSVIITHDMACARITSDKMVVINDGKFAAEGTYEKLSQSNAGWVKAFFE